MLMAMSLLLISVAHAGAVTYIYTDPQGTPLAEADAIGNITATYDYAPYGAQAMGAAPNGPGYAGHVNDPESGLVYMQARYYDPVIGRFLSTDPVSLFKANIYSFNKFAYANDNPIVNVDPDGRYTCTQSGKSVSCRDSGITKLVDGIKAAQTKYSPKSAAYTVLSRVLSTLGESDKPSKITFDLVERSNNSPGGAEKGGTIKLDMRQLSSGRQDYNTGNPGKSPELVTLAIGSGTVGHEVQHEIDYIYGAYPTNRSDEKATEINAYATEAYIGKGLGINIGLNSPADIHDAAEASTNAWCAGNASGCK